ncbi:cytochrome P460 family protein [Leptolyngbya sp. FACHB-541]|nr:cytochrome P460 family protein [Leptolyngbya sp. FACHB-541]
MDRHHSLTEQTHYNQPPTTPSPITNATASEVQIESKYDRTLAHYATVSRSDGSFRQMFVNEEAIPKGATEPNASIQPGEPLPDGTLIVMETWYSPENLGTVFVKQKQNGEWQYGSFSPDRPDYQMRFSGSCHSCHTPFPEADFTLTKPLLEAALQTRQVQTAYCDRAGRTPCDPQAYIPNAEL